MLLLLVVALRWNPQKAPMDRAWWTATLVLVVMHATDMPFFDSRLNIAGLDLLAGLAAFGFRSGNSSSPGQGLIVMFLQLRRSSRGHRDGSRAGSLRPMVRGPRCSRAEAAVGQRLARLRVPH